MHAVLRVAAALTVLLAASTPALATHQPSNSEIVSYDATLAPGAPAVGAIGWATPVDGYDWYCFTGTAGTPVSLTMTRTSGDILPNIQVYLGVTNSGTSLGASGLAFVTGTSSSNAGPAVLNFTPTATAIYTVALSTFTGENGGNYSAVMTGGTSATCAAAPPVPVQPADIPTLSEWGLILTSLLIAAATFLTLRRRR